VRNFYSVSISGYHIAEAGANPISQLAFTLANGFTIVEYYLARGMKIDDFAPNLSFFFSNGMDPEYAVIGRVARRIWARAMKRLYGASPRSQMLKYHIQTSGRSLHAQEMQFNDIRTTLQALYALFDNCNSLHTNAFDEALTTPTEASVRRAVAIQLIINRELGLNRNQNPWQGSYAIDYLTDQVEEAVYQEFERLSERGGVLGAMESMYQRGRIQEESLYYEHKKHDGSLPLIGVNTFLGPDGAGEASVEEGQLIRSSEQEKQAQVASTRAFNARWRRGRRACAGVPCGHGRQWRQRVRGADGDRQDGVRWARSAARSTRWAASTVATCSSASGRRFPPAASACGPGAITSMIEDLMQHSRYGRWGVLAALLCCCCCRYAQRPQAGRAPWKRPWPNSRSGVEEAAGSQTRVVQLADETSELLGEYRVTVQRLDRVRIYNDNLEALVRDQEREQADIDRQLASFQEVQQEIVPLMFEMIDDLARFVELDMPFQLQERRDRVERLRELMDRSDVTVSEKYRQIMGAYQIEADFSRSTEAYAGTLGERRVEFLASGASCWPTRRRTAPKPVSGTRTRVTGRWRTSTATTSWRGCASRASRRRRTCCACRCPRLRRSAHDEAHRLAVAWRPAGGDGPRACRPDGDRFAGPVAAAGARVPQPAARRQPGAGTALPAESQRAAGAVAAGAGGAGRRREPQ
jgi:hypothetical protein